MVRHLDFSPYLSHPTYNQHDVSCNTGIRCVVNLPRLQFQHRQLRLDLEKVRIVRINMDKGEE